LTTSFGEIPYPEIFWPVVASLFGLLIGSFLNVCIHRLPRDESVIKPRSHCPACGHGILWYENIPLLSYLALRGKCSKCGIRISPQYFLVELANGLLYGGLAVLLGPGLELIKYAVFGSLMLALTIIDFKDRVLPDELTLAGVILGAAFSLLVPVSDGLAAFVTRPLGPWPLMLLSAFDSVLGMTLGAGVLWMVREAYFYWRKVEGMGFGDLKLMAAIGAFLGPTLTLLTIFLGSLAGALLGGVFILIFRNRDTRYELPFGTFLGGMALVTALWGRGVVQWYLALF
jgi:leader peptidase (prepilin peptidase)/N-methyltransferase